MLTFFGAISVASRFGRFLSELKRRKVYQVGAVYLGVGLAIALAVAELFSTFSAPDWAAQAVIAVVALGFPVALVLAWAYEVRPEEPPALDATGTKSDQERAKTSEGKKSIVVLPFDNMSPDEKDAYFADGLTEEIITRLSFIRSNDPGNSFSGINDNTKIFQFVF